MRYDHARMAIALIWLAGCAAADDMDSSTQGLSATWDASWAVGTHLPDLAFIDSSETVTRLNDHDGDWQMVEVTSMWMGPGQLLSTESPRILAHHQGQGLRWITVLREDTTGDEPDAEDLEQWSQTQGLSHRVVRDPDGHTQSMEPAWPQLRLIDRSGVVVEDTLAVDPDALCEALRAWTKAGPCADEATR